MGFIDNEDLRMAAASEASRSAVEAQRNTYTPDKPGWQEGFNAGIEGREPAHQTAAPEGWADGYSHGLAYRRMSPSYTLVDFELAPPPPSRAGETEGGV